MGTLNTNALVTLAELSAYLDTSLATVTTSSGSYQSINQSSQWIESHLGYGSIVNSPSGSQYSDIFNGLGYNYEMNFFHDKVCTSRPLIIGTPELWYRMSSIAIYPVWTTPLNFVPSTWSQVPTNTYDWNPVTGVVRLTNGNYFFPGVRNWKVQYRYGFTRVEDVAADIKLACLILCKFIMIQSEKLGLSAETNRSGTSKTVNLTDVPKQVTDILKYYKDFVNNK